MPVTGAGGTAGADQWIPDDGHGHTYASATLLGGTFAVFAGTHEPIVDHLRMLNLAEYCSPSLNFT
jgi:hypothetical protein